MPGIGKTISNSINPKARVAFGITQNKKEEIKITLLVNGCKWDEWAEYNSSATLVKGTSKKEKPEKELLKEKPKKKAQNKPEEKPPELLRVQRPEITKISTEKPKRVKIQVKNALDYNLSASLPAFGRAPIKKSIEKEEKKMIAQERKWETPAFLRRKPSQFEEKSKVQ